MQKRHVMAFDLGASSGRGIAAEFDGERIQLTEVHRFPHTFENISGKAYWKFPMLMGEMERSLGKWQGEIDSLGIDTWGVDCGFLDRSGNLLDLPRSYRDVSFDERNMEEALEALGGEEQLFRETKIASLPYNTLFQLWALKKEGRILEKAHKILMMPNLLEYFFCGEKHGEYSSVSTSQIFCMKEKMWSRRLIERIGVSESVFPQVTMAGKVLGTVCRDIGERTGKKGIKVVSVPGHDTASAIAAVPAKEKNYTFLSSGTWSLMGIASDQILESPDAVAGKISNEGTWDGGYRPTVNISGLWMIQQCKRQWEKEGEKLSFGEMTGLAEKAEPFRAFLRPEDFVQDGNYPAMICGFCEKTGQKIPETKGDIIRCILESLALKYRMTYDTLKPYQRWENILYIVGGGVQNQLLNQWTANALGIPVVTGPSEATAVGNIMIQLEALGEISGRQQRQQIISRSFEARRYEPENTAEWEEAYQRFLELYKM